MALAIEDAPSRRRKFLDLIARSEGADYDTIVGGGRFSDTSRHPRTVGLTTPDGPSTAAGRYQITASTYDSVANRLGIRDFSPESQDSIAIELMRENGALDDVDAGNFRSAIGKLGSVWASFPSSPYKQPKRSWGELLGAGEGGATLRDFLTPEVSAKFPDDILSKKGRRILSLPIPSDYDSDRASAAAKLVEEHLPKLTEVARLTRKVRRAQQSGAPTPPEQLAAEQAQGEAAGYAKLPLAAKLLMQAGAGVNTTLPSWTERPLIDYPDQAPLTSAERLARAVGSIGTFGLEALPIAAATGGAGMAPLSGALAAGIPSAAMPGTKKQRAVRGAVMGATGGATALVGGLVGSVAGKTAEAVAGIPIGAAAFGGVAPVAEHAAMKALGEETEAPKFEDLLRSMGELGVASLLVHGAQVGADRALAPRPAAPGAPPAVNLRQAPEVPTAPASASEAPAARAPVPAIPDEAAPAVWGVAKGNGTDGPKGKLTNSYRNPLDQNRTELESFKARLAESGARTPEEWTEAARKARRQVRGLTDLHEKVRPPAGGSPELRAAGEKASDQWTEYLGGKGIVLKSDKGEVGGRVEGVFIYPWSDQQVRIVLRDEHTGQVVARTYPTPAALTADIVGMGRSPQPAAPKPTPKPKAAPKAAGNNPRNNPAPTRAGGTEQAIPGLETTDPKKAQATARALNAQHPEMAARVVEQGGKFKIVAGTTALEKAVAAPVDKKPAPGAAPADRAAGPAESPAAPVKPLRKGEAASAEQLEQMTDAELTEHFLDNQRRLSETRADPDGMVGEAHYRARALKRIAAERARRKAGGATAPVEKPRPAAPADRAAGPAESPAAPASSTGLAEIGGAAKAIGDNFRDMIFDKLSTTGKVPAIEKGTAAGRAAQAAWDAGVRDREGIVRAMESPAAPAPRKLAAAAPLKGRDLVEKMTPILNKHDLSLPHEAQRAVTNFVGHAPGAVDRGELGVGIMNEGPLEDAYSATPTPEGKKVREQLAAARVPLLDELRKVYGDEITLYRAQRPVAADARPRNVLSWTANKKFAEEVAGLKGYGIISDKQIEDAVVSMEKTGTAKVRGKTYRFDAEDEFPSIVVGDHDYTIDVNEGQSPASALRKDLLDTQRDLAEHAKSDEALAGERIQTKTVPLTDIVWATDRAGQHEFILRNEKPAAPRPAAPLEQQRLDVPPRELPAGPKAKATKAGDDAVLAMGGDAKSFEEHFADLVKKGRKPEDARAEAEKLSGQPAARGFDAEARAKALLHRAAEEAGQGSLFGAPEPPPAARGESAAVPERKAEGVPVAPSRDAGHAAEREFFEGAKPAPKKGYSLSMEHDEIVAMAREQVAEQRAQEASKAEAGTARAQSLHFHEKFQQRDTDAGLVDAAHIRQMLEKHGGYSHDELVKNPVTVWTDTKGEIGPEGRTYVLSGHHRAYVAQRTWEKLADGQHAEVSISDREVPVVKFKGSYEEALHEAETSNLKGKPNTTVEKAGVARRMADRGSDVKKIAAEIGLSVPATQDLLNLSHLDPALQRQYFGEKGLPVSAGSFLGAVAKRLNVHPEHQRAWLQKLANKEIASTDELQDVVNSYLEVLKAANQTSLLGEMDMGPGAISPSMAHDYVGAAFKLAGKNRREAAAAAKQMQKEATRGISPARAEAAEALLGEYRKDWARSKRIEAEVQRRLLKAISDATAEGKPVADAVYKVKEWIDAQMRFGDRESGATTIFSDGPAGRWLTKAVRRGIKRAIGREAAHQREPRTDGPDWRGGDDDYDNFVTTRLIAKMRLGNWQDVLPNEQQHDYITQSAVFMQLKARYEQLWQEVMGSPEAAEYFGEGGTGSRELSKALHGKPNRIPAEFRDAVARVKRYQDDVFAALESHAAATKQAAPKRRGDYGHAHIVPGTRAEPFTSLLESIEKRSGNDMAQGEIDEMHNRFLDRRRGSEQYVDDATFAIRQYTDAAIRKIAWDPFLTSVKKYLDSDHAQGKDFERASVVRDWTRIRFMRNRSVIEVALNDALRPLLFRGMAQGVREVGLKRAAKVLGRPVEALKLDGIEKVAWAPEGAEIPGATDLGPWAGGRLIGGDAEATFFAAGAPLARKWVRGAMESMARLNMVGERATGMMKLRDDEAWIRHQFKIDRKLERLADAPLETILNATTGAISRSIFFHNVGTAAINAMGTMVTTLPEYGARAYMHGLLGASKAVTRGAVRAAMNGYLAHAEKVGWLSRADAEAARKMLPLTIEEVYAEATGTIQREALDLERRGRDIAEGKNPDVQAVLRALISYGDVLFSFAEGLNRTISVLAADSFARRKVSKGGLGRTRSVPEEFESMQDARDRFAKALGNPDSPESFAARSTLLDQFAYDEGSYPMFASGPFGRVGFHLMRWQIAAAKRYGLRTSEAAVRSAASAARGASGKARLEGRARAPGWFNQWLEDNGAGWSQRHGAAVFTRSVAVSALLLGLARRTGIGFSNAGMSPPAMVGLILLRAFFPNDDEIARWYQQGKEGSMVGLDRMPVGPVPQAAMTGLSAVGGGYLKPRRAGSRPADFPWESVLGTVRLGLIRGEPQMKKMIAENPQWFIDHAPWVFKAFGIKTLYPDMTPAQVARHQTRTMTAEERRQLSVPAPR